LKYRNLIFDFDGVLAESIDIKTKAFYDLYRPYGMDVAEKVSSHHKANGGMSRFEKFPYYHKMFLNEKIDNEKIQSLSLKFSKLVVKGVIEAEEVIGSTWFLDKHSDKRKWIVSATPSNEISQIVNKRGIYNHFISVFGSPQKKSDIIKNIINDNNLIKSETLFLGDAMQDFNAARENKIDFILRKTIDNRKQFINFSEMRRFNDFFELDKILDEVK
jgi:HAD superfamily hydrolase (TIGR01549 family)